MQKKKTTTTKLEFWAPKDFDIFRTSLKQSSTQSCCQPVKHKVRTSSRDSRQSGIRIFAGKGKPEQYRIFFATKPFRTCVDDQYAFQMVSVRQAVTLNSLSQHAPQTSDNRQAAPEKPTVYSEEPIEFLSAKITTKQANPKSTPKQAWQA